MKIFAFSFQSNLQIHIFFVHTSSDTNNREKLFSSSFSQNYLNLHIFFHYTAHYSAPFVWTFWIGNFCSSLDSWEVSFSSFKRYKKHATSHFCFRDKMLHTRYNSNFVCVPERAGRNKTSTFRHTKKKKELRLSGILKSTKRGEVYWR